MKQNKKSGFTLIELLVVIAVISVLVSVVLASLNTARGKARDAKRRTDLSQIQTALELYRNEHGTFQVAGAGWLNGGQGWLSFEDGNVYDTAVTRVLHNEGFLPEPIIEDPLQTPGYMVYLCDDGQSYALSATLEFPTDADIANTQASCNGTGINGTYNRYGKNTVRKN